MDDALRIDCLMGTYGRASLAGEAVACFLRQSALSQATLLVYNQHPRALHFDHPRVRVVNEPPPVGSLRHIRKRMHELSDPSAEFLHWWDDDDLYLPWHLEDCLENIGAGVAWRPLSCWVSSSKGYSLARGTFEGAWIFRAEYLRTAPLDTHPTYTDHPVIRQTLDANRLGTTDLAGRTSYIYRWHGAPAHVSAYAAEASEASQRANLELWRLRCRDVPSDGNLVPPDLTPRWSHYLEGTRGSVDPVAWEVNRKRCLALESPPSAITKPPHRALS